MNLGFNDKELQQISEMPNLPGSIQSLATDEYVRLATEIKTSFGAVDHFIQNNGTLPSSTAITYDMPPPGLKGEGSYPLIEREGSDMQIPGHCDAGYRSTSVRYNERQAYPPPVPPIANYDLSRKICITRGSLPEREASEIEKLEFMGQQLLEEITD